MPEPMTDQQSLAPAARIVQGLNSMSSDEQVGRLLHEVDAGRHGAMSAPDLRTLLAGGWVDAAYVITPRGHRALTRWLETQGGVS